MCGQRWRDDRLHVWVEADNALRGGGDANLPKAVKKLPKALRELWVRVFNENYDPDDEGAAHKIAWAAVRKVESAHAAKDWLQVDRPTLLAWLNGKPQGELPMPETEDKAFALQERERAVSAAFAQAFGGLAVRVYDTYLIGLVPPELRTRTKPSTTMSRCHDGHDAKSTGKCPTTWARPRRARKK